MASIPLRVAALKRAVTQLGVTEHPPGSNDGPQIREYRRSVAPGLPPGPWCMYFVHWCYAPWIYLPDWGNVGRFQDWAAQKGYVVQRPFRGDIVCYDWDNDRWWDHVGIVERVLALRWRGRAFAGWVQTIEGNTAVGNDSNGGKVMRRRRWVGTVKFARVPGSVPK